jgi:hypothetical protein
VEEGDLFERWGRWMAIIQQEVWRMHVNRSVWVRFAEVVTANEELRQRSTTFASWATENYIAAQVMAIRRQVDRDSRTVSIIRLLDDIASNPGVITRERFVTVNAGGDTELAAHMWGPLADPTGEYLNAEVVQDDVQQLKNTAQTVQDFGNQRVAHRDQREWTEVVTFRDLDECVDGIGRLSEQYGGLLLGTVIFRR